MLGVQSGLPGLFVRQDDQSGDFFVFDQIHDFLASFILVFNLANQRSLNERDHRYIYPLDIDPCGLD